MFCKKQKKKQKNKKIANMVFVKNQKELKNRTVAVCVCL